MEKEMWLIWKEPKSRRRYKIGALNFDDNSYAFKYTNPELDDAVSAGFKYYPGFEDLEKEYQSEELFINIATRLPNLNRSDYLEILNYYGLKSNSTQLEILKATKGRLITDNYEFVPAFDKSEITFTVAGTNHSDDILKCKDKLSINDVVTLELDKNNMYDDNAIKVMFRKNMKVFHLGYVPRYYTKELTKLLNANKDYSAMLESLNFESKISGELVEMEIRVIFKD